MKVRGSEEVVSLPCSQLPTALSHREEPAKRLLLMPINEPTCLPINYYYKISSVAIGIHIHVLCTQGHTCTCMHVCVVLKFSFPPLPLPVLQVASDEKPLSLAVQLIASWGPHSWRGRDPVCCADGQSTKMGWSCPGLQPPLHFGIPARPLPEPQSHTVPWPNAPAVGETRDGNELGRLVFGMTITQRSRELLDYSESSEPFPKADFAEI